MTQQEVKQTPPPLSQRWKLTYALVLFMVALLVFVGIRLFARTAEIEVCGDLSFYTAQDLIASSEIQIGKRLYGVDEEETIQKLLDKHPLLESVRIEQKGFFGIILIVTEKHPVYYTVQDDYFFTLSQDLCVLRRTEVLSDTGAALPQLQLPSTQPLEIGQKIAFVNENSDYIMSFLTELRTHSFYSSLTCLNVTDRYDLKVIYGQDLEIRLGNPQNMAAKCKKIEDWLLTVTPSLYKGFNVIDPNKSFSSEKTA